MSIVLKTKVHDLDVFGVLLDFFSCVEHFRILRRHGKKLKPIDEMEVSPALEREIGMRQRIVTIPENIASFREDLLRVWTNIRCKQSLENAAVSDPILFFANCFDDLSSITIMIFFSFT